MTILILEIWVSHATVSLGQRFREIEDLHANLALENQLLENEIASFSAISRTASIASEAGFIRPKNIQYIR